MCSIDDDLIDLERIVVRLRNVSTDTTAAESSLAGLRRRYTSLCDSKLSELLTAVSRAAECECEHRAVVQWMTGAENQLQALDDDRSLSAEDKHQQLEVHEFV